MGSEARRAGSRELAGADRGKLFGGGSQCNQVDIDPVASGLSCRACIHLHSLVDLASCSGGFSREQMRGFHDLLRQKPTSQFILLGWSSVSVEVL
jgi:hypothetical protein